MSELTSIIGRWDLTITRGDSTFPSWLEVNETATGGRFVGEVGSARPIPTLSFADGKLNFSLPPQYEGYPSDMVFEAELKDGKLHGTHVNKEGQTLTWVGIPQDPLARSGEPTWGDPIELIGGDLSNWHPRSPDWTPQWSIVDRDLVNAAVGSDLVTNDKFTDFKLVAEYSYPAGSNSGIYLRGRYEFQIFDDFGSEPSVGSSGAIYGFLVPTSQAIKPHGERNIAEITLVGRTITVVLNGVTIHEAQEIPGITGGALDSNEGEPGPLFIQGDHGPVTYHRLTLYPAN